MEQQMTVEEMRAQFVDEWILINDPETNESLELLSGKVVCHSKDRDEVYREAVDRRSKRRRQRYAVLYTGEIPEGTAVVL
jgi:hypothetical protein